MSVSREVSTIKGCCGKHFLDVLNNNYNLHNSLAYYMFISMHSDCISYLHTAIVVLRVAIPQETHYCSTIKSTVPNNFHNNIIQQTHLSRSFNNIKYLIIKIFLHRFCPSMFSWRPCWAQVCIELINIKHMENYSTMFVCENTSM